VAWSGWWAKSVPHYTGASARRLNPGVPGAAAQKIRALDDLAREMSLRLGAN